MISANLAAIFYLVSGILFILALRGLSSPDTSRQGNYFGIAGMIIAIVVTFLSIGNFSKVILLLSIVVIIFIAKEIIDNYQSYSSIGLAMIVGGAIGNLIDRVLVQVPAASYGGVVDFIDIGTSTFRWYTFNIADSCVCIGMFLYLLLGKLDLSN